MNKKKKKSTKLTLSSETLRNLSEPEVRQVAGEAATARCTALCTATHACSGCAPCA